MRHNFYLKLWNFEVNLRYLDVFSLFTDNVNTVICFVTLVLDCRNYTGIPALCFLREFTVQHEHVIRVSDKINLTAYSQAWICSVTSHHTHSYMINHVKHISERLATTSFTDIYIACHKHLSSLWIGCYVKYFLKFKREIVM